MRQAFRDLPGLEHSEGTLRTLTAALEVDDGDVERLTVRVSLMNEAETTVFVLNPFETLQFDVRDSKGRPVRLSSRPPEALIHRLPGTGPGSAPAFPVLAFRRNGQVEDPQALSGPTLTLAGHERFEASLLLNSSIGGMPEDRYTVSGLMTIIHAEHLNVSRIIRTAPIYVSVRPANAS